jgi:hypothetical protein
MSFSVLEVRDSLASKRRSEKRGIRGDCIAWLVGWFVLRNRRHGVTEVLKGDSGGAFAFCWLLLLLLCNGGFGIIEMYGRCVYTLTLPGIPLSSFQYIQFLEMFWRYLACGAIRRVAANQTAFRYQYLNIVDAAVWEKQTPTQVLSVYKTDAPGKEGKQDASNCSFFQRRPFPFSFPYPNIDTEG